MTDPPSGSRLLRLTALMRRTRFAILLLLGALYVFLPSTLADGRWHQAFLVVAGMLLWVPFLVDLVVNFRRGYQEEQTTE